MKKILTFVSPISTYFVLYNTSFAAVCTFVGIQNFKEFVTRLISCMLTPIASLIISLAVVTFIYGVFKFIRAEGEDKQGGRELMFWGIVGIFVMVSLWGLVNVLQSTFKL